jgi:hypothetical protein
MDASPSPKQTMRLVLEIDRTPDGRLEGRLRSDATNPWMPFSGVLELLKVIEEHTSISTMNMANTTHEDMDPL